MGIHAWFVGGPGSEDFERLMIAGCIPRRPGLVGAPDEAERIPLSISEDADLVVEKPSGCWPHTKANIHVAGGDER